MKIVMNYSLLLCVLLSSFFLCCNAEDEVQRKEKFKLYSPAFKNKGCIPEKYTAAGENYSPEFFWKGVPKETKTFALSCKDVSDPRGDKVHWFIYNIPAIIDHLPEGIGRTNTLSMGAFQGMNDFKHVGYDGPLAMVGRRHRFVFTLYALDAELPLKPCSSYESLRLMLPSYVIAETHLTGYFTFIQHPKDTGPCPFTDYFWE